MQPFCKTKVLVLFLFMHIQTTDDQYTFNESLHLIFWCIQNIVFYYLSLLTFYVSLSSTENKIGPDHRSKKEK